MLILLLGEWNLIFFLKNPAVLLIRLCRLDLRWKFLSEDADIGFHIYFFNGKEKVDLIPFERVNAHIMMEEGMVMSSHAATRKIFININSFHWLKINFGIVPDFVEFDNSYSYIRSKKIWFSVNTEELEHTKKVTPVLNDQVEKAFKQYYNTKIARTVKWWF